MKYGKTALEAHMEKMQQCRDIVQEILNFGINEEQKLKIIYLLSLELENRENMINVSSQIQSILDEDTEENKEIILT